MIPCENIEIFCSVVFYVLTLLISVLFKPQMHGKRTLTSIPEYNEDEEKLTKWVPKKKHEVLKAKYKCLKKLFQIYDASVIGIIPDSYGTEEAAEDESETRSRRKKRSHRTKTDACAGTTEVSNGDLSDHETEKSVATALIRDTSSLGISTKSEDQKTEQPQESKATLSNVSERDCECNFTQTVSERPGMDLHNCIHNQLPCLLMNERPRLTRFQSFIQRIFGLKQDRSYRNYVLPNGHVYPASDYCVRRRRRMRSPTILSYVQSVQRNCLMDTTPRQCPIMGCRMISYGIINYNDHLNLCHFNDRKFSCHYCHEGFEKEYDKYTHENEHIGITKLNNFNYSLTSTTNESGTKANNTQTDAHSEVPEDKLKKIVSFFDKMVDNDLLERMKKNSRYSESNLQTIHNSTRSDCVTEQDTMSNSSSDKRAVSCGNLLNGKLDKTMTESDATSKHSSEAVKCHFCGEDFDYRRQLSLHVDLEHRVHDKYSKFHSCAGISNAKPRPQHTIGVEDGRLKVHTESSDLRRIATSSTISNYYQKSLKSEVTVSCDPSTNIIYYESEEAKKPSVVDSFVKKVKGVSYKWEPGTKIIRV